MAIGVGRRDASRERLESDLLEFFEAALHPPNSRWQSVARLQRPVPLFSWRDPGGDSVPGAGRTPLRFRKKPGVFAGPSPRLPWLTSSRLALPVLSRAAKPPRSTRARPPLVWP